MKTLVIGAGKIGTSIVKMLKFVEGWDVSIADTFLESLDRFDFDGDKVFLDGTNEVLTKAIANYDIVLSACPYTANVEIATACLETGASYFDLTEDRYSTEAIRKIASGAKEGQVFAPQCGLAPGFIGILGNDLAQQFDKVEEVKMRVGALPLYPQNTMLYNLTWSTEGLINEYSNACEAVVNGKVVDTIPLEELENFSMQGVNYECFNTSGGLGTLCETLDGKVKNMNYKTVRFPGHQHLMKFFLKDLRMGEKGKNRQMAMDIFDNAVPVTPQDYVLAFATVKGYINEKLVVKSEVYNIPHQRWVEEDWTSIQITTSAGACVMMDLFKKGYFKKGFAKQEDVKLHNFLNSPFGHCYSRGRITK